MPSYEKRQKKMLMDEIVDRLLELEELGYRTEEILDELAEKYVHPEEPEDIADYDVHINMDEDDRTHDDALDSILPSEST